jgi:hypothetical protein
MKCDVEECLQSPQRRGFCYKHYRRWLKYGSALTIKRAPNGAPRQMIEQAIRYRGDDCLLWPFRTPDGYGRIKEDGVNYLAHRIVCRRVHGPSPKDRPFATHKCGNGHLGCLTPKHLRWGSPQDNQDDMVRHGRSTRGERSSAATLKEQQVVEINRRLDAGEITSKIADDFSISWGMVHKIKIGWTWAWLTGRQAPRRAA